MALEFFAKFGKTVDYDPDTHGAEVTTHMGNLIAYHILGFDLHTDIERLFFCEGQ